MEQDEVRETAFIIPVYNDYESVEKVIELLVLNWQNHSRNENYKIIIVDDASTDKLNPSEILMSPNVQIIELKTKSGSQKAILVGIVHVIAHFPGYDVLILDGDGEDNPGDAFELMRAARVEKILPDVVIAKRGRRHVGLSFRLSYFIFQKCFQLLTGAKFETGNFMWISNESLQSISELPTMRFHLSASINRYARRIKFVKMDRDHRIFGQSKMNYSRLALHGLGALSVFSDLAVIRFAFMAVLISFITLGLGLSLLVARIMHWFQLIPGWASIIFFQALFFSLSLVTVSTLGLLLIINLNAFHKIENQNEF